MGTTSRPLRGERGTSEHIMLRSVKWKHESVVISHALKTSSLCRCWRQTVWVAFSRLTLWPAVFGRCWILSTCLMALPSHLMRTSCFWLRPVSDILSSKSSSAALSLFIYQDGRVSWGRFSAWFSGSGWKDLKRAPRRSSWTTWSVTLITSVSVTAARF